MFKVTGVLPNKDERVIVASDVSFQIAIQLGKLARRVGARDILITEVKE